MTVEIHKSPLKKKKQQVRKNKNIFFKLNLFITKNMRETEIARSLNILKRTPSIPISLKLNYFE